jgi:hypothetical protein
MNIIAYAYSSPSSYIFSQSQLSDFLALAAKAIEERSKLITKEGSQQQFKNEIQREIGRKLRSHQLGRAAYSIIRARTYIENMLHMVSIMSNTTLSMGIS